PKLLFRNAPSAKLLFRHAHPAPAASPIRGLPLSIHPFSFVGGAKPVPEVVSILHDQVEDAEPVAFAFGAGGCGFAFDAVGEKPLEDQPRIDLAGIRGRFGPPGDVARVGATVAGVAVAGLPARLAA